MAVKFNPFTGQLQIDEKGSGGGGSSYIDGEVQNFSALPETLGTPAVDSAYLVREAEGTWLLNRKPAGIYIRTANTGTRASDWTYAGEFPDVFNDANFVLYDNGDSTKNLQFQLSGIATGTTRTIAVPNKNITLDDAGDSRTPTAHAAAHASAGSDPLAPSDIGAADRIVRTSSSLSTNITLSAARSRHITYALLGSAFTVTLPTSDNQAGDVVRLTSSGSSAASSILSVERSGAVLLGSIAPSQTLSFYNTDGTASGWLLDPVDTHTHAASDITSGSFGNISHDGKLGTTAGLPVVTTTAGAVTTLALGTANQVLRVNSGATAVEFADPAASGVTGAASSASDVLGVSGSNITGVDAGTADRLVFWDDSAGKLTHLSLGSNALSIDGTTLKSQPMFSVDPISRGATYIPYIGAASNGNSSAAVNTGVGYVLFSPVYIRKSANYTTFSCIVASAGSASSLGKMALYSIKTTDATPDALVCESGTFATDSTGIKQPTMASTFVSEGWYYMALATNSTTNVLFYGDTMLLLRGVFSGAALNTQSALFDYSSKLYADLWPNPWNGTGSTFRNAFHPITSLT